MSIFAPYYVHRPSQILRRIVRQSPPIRLPWGAMIDCNPDDSMSGALIRNGVYDLPVSEALWRLTDPGDFCIDAGANIGYTTSIMAHRSGPSGSVLSYEPHPDTSAQLARNVSRWGSGAAITVRSSALSSSVGVGTLTSPADFATNSGAVHLGGNGHGGCQVRLTTLDHEVAGRSSVGMLKIDVEGHEIAVLQGATQTIPRVRDIVYEDHPLYPSQVSIWLEARGYTIFALCGRFRGPWLAPPTTRGAANAAPNYLATRDATRAISRCAVPRFAVHDWRCLRGRR